jgi:hypothetical protein
MKSYVNFQDIYSNGESIRKSTAHKLVNAGIYVDFCVRNTILQWHLIRFSYHKTVMSL